ncbi:Uncharacterised protein [Mycobacterium tuberculosis]|nr:Uncharacterised protein [Mycobacterium tuberculosis]
MVVKLPRAQQKSCRQDASRVRVPFDVAMLNHVASRGRWYTFIQNGLATQHMVEGDLGLAALSELGQGLNTEREMIGLDVKVDSVLIAKPLIKCEMPRPIAVFV